MTPLGALALALAAGGLILRRPTLRAVALGFGAGVPASAGIVAGPVALSVFVAVAVLVGCSPAPRRGPRVQDPGLSTLVGFVGWALLMTAIGPWVFAGVPVLVPGMGIDEQVHAPSTLGHTIGNASQAVYLLAGFAAARFLWRTGTAPLAVLVAAWTGTVLSAARGLLRAAGADGTAWLFDTLAVDYSGVGDSRLRGVFAEPSELAAFSLAVVAFAAVRAVRATDGRRRWSAGTLFLIAAADLVASASGTAVAAGCIAAAALAASVITRFIASGGRHVGPILLTGLAGVFVVVAAGPHLVEPAMAIVEEKIGSQSFDSRTAADAIGVHVLEETRGLGAGLGSNRSSSFLVTLLSTTGIVGVGLFASAVLTLLHRSSRVAAGAPAAAALLGLLIAKSVSAPDLSTPVMWILVATCVHFGARRESSAAVLDAIPTEIRQRRQTLAR